MPGSFSFPDSSPLSACGGFRKFPVAALTLQKILDCVPQVRGFEFRPHSGREKQFGVSAFPQHEIAQAMVPAGAKQQTHIQSRAARMRPLAEPLREFALRYLQAREHPTRGTQYGVARRIIYGDAQFENPRGSCDALGSLNRL